MKIYLARHGQTNYNELGLCNADPTVDVHLTDTGIQQSESLAENLKDVDFEVIFVSELNRTQQTAGIINKFHHADIKIDPNLNDNRTGFEGLPSADYYDALKKADNKWTVRFNDGESLADTKARTKHFIEELKTKPYKTVLVVTSMSVVQAFYGIINGFSDEQAWDFEVDKGSCVEIDI